MLRANEGKIINTSANSKRINVSLSGESGVSGPDAVITISMPIIPKATEAYINIRVAIFCMSLLYHLKSLIAVAIVQQVTASRGRPLVGTVRVFTGNLEAF